MQILINNNKTIAKVQEEFSDAYPWLKLEFFAKPSKVGGMASKKLIRNTGTTLGECRSIHANGNLTITPDMTVGNLLQSFMDVYGLSVKLLRKSGKSWINTSLTESWTLEEQNSQGESLSAEAAE
ncbi:MAG: hypothetical protein IAF38_13250 [Bacteroidia bacterium]|nr:hypothetical protein [Bacteroidia bacterium]